MKNKQTASVNIPASVKDRLYFIARTNNVEFNSVMRQYFQERFLFRLSKSKYSEHFILKGALLFLAYDISRNRPTQDIDFLGKKISSDMTEIEQIIKEIANIDFADGVFFLKDTIKTERIKEDSDYKGVRVHLHCTLGTIKNVLQIDIAFGDKIVYGPNKIEFPIILDFEPPIIQVYSIVSAIAEKFEAIVSLGLSSSRMKDYYDILFFASHHSFISEEIAEAIRTTFKNRETEISDYKYIFNNKFKANADLQQMWEAFIGKRKLGEESEFSEVVSKIEVFLLQCLVKPNEKMIWNYTSFNWEKTSCLNT